MNVKGRPEKLTDKLKQWIATNQKSRKKRLKAPAIQEEIKRLLEMQVRKEAFDRGIDWTEKVILGEVEERLPGVSSIQKYLQQLDKRDTPSSLDKPWHLGLISDRDFMSNPEYRVTPEALPYISFLQLWVSKNNEQPLTIRHVLWASRLYAVVCSKVIPKGKKLNKELQNLWAYSGGYAWYERICEISDTKFDTTILDEGLLGLGDWRDIMFSLIAPVELKEGRCNPELFAWLLNKTKDKPAQRLTLYEILHIPTEKDGEQ